MNDDFLRARRQVELNAMLDSAIAFMEATKTLVADMNMRGYRPHDPKPVAGPGTRSVGDVWRASSAVAHFNLHQALEAYMKLVIALEGSRSPSIHRLTKLYGMMSRESRMEFKRLYRNKVVPAQTDRQIGVAFIFSDVPPKSPANTTANTVRQWFGILDDTMRLHTRRYEAEDVRCARWTVYFVDFEPVFELLYGVAGYAAELLERKTGNGPAGAGTNTP